MRAQLFIVLFACLAVSYAADFSSFRYQEKKAEEKMALLWGNITADTTPYGWYSALSQMGLFFEGMKPTFDTYSDVIPGCRKKLIHSVGSVVQAKFIAEEGSPYTGMFKGVSNALIRISAAKQPNPKGQPEGNFAPGMGIKLLRDGMPSANLVAMYSVEGQDSWNIFKNDWSHHIANACSYALKLLSKKFAEATPFVGRVGLKDWAQFDEQGFEVVETHLKVPFRLIFRAARDVRDIFPDTYAGDYNDQLATIPVGTALWDVYAAPKPHADAVKIGTFMTTSKFTTSRFGDKDLFFQHKYMEDDLEVHPDWEEATKINPPVESKVIE